VYSQQTRQDRRRRQGAGGRKDGSGSGARAEGAIVGERKTDQHEIVPERVRNWTLCVPDRTRRRLSLLQAPAVLPCRAPRGSASSALPREPWLAARRGLGSEGVRNDVLLRRAPLPVTLGISERFIHSQVHPRRSRAQAFDDGNACVRTNVRIVI